MSLLTVENLSVQFDAPEGLVRAVDGVSFCVKPGETLAFVGESGSGKTVTCLALMGLLPDRIARVSSGTVLWEEKNLLEASPLELRRIRGNRMAMVFQDPMTALNPYLRVGKQLTEVLTTHRSTPHGEALLQAIAMLERVGLSDPEGTVTRYPHQLSGGMQQRVMIAMALLCEPSLLIADEPTTALDVTIQAQVLDLLKELQQSLGIALLLVSHDLGVVAGLADRVAVFYGGRIVETASTLALYPKPRHPYTQALLSSVPRMDRAKVDSLEVIPGVPLRRTDDPVGCGFAPRCPHAMEQCRSEKPTFSSSPLAKEDVQVACWVCPEYSS